MKQFNQFDKCDLSRSADAMTQICTFFTLWETDSFKVSGIQVFKAPSLDCRWIQYFYFVIIMQLLMRFSTPIAASSPVVKELMMATCVQIRQSPFNSSQGHHGIHQAPASHPKSMMVAVPSGDCL